jgi:hypothetical protein
MNTETPRKRHSSEDADRQIPRPDVKAGRTVVHEGLDHAC